MRAPFQILALPYRIIDGDLYCCVMHRSNSDMWQFIAGGGEDHETPEDAAKREILEEGGIITDDLIFLKSMCYIPAGIYGSKHTKNWPDDLYVLPEYAFAFPCECELTISCEHDRCVWLSYGEAQAVLKWDSNRTALYELKCMIFKKRI